MAEANHTREAGGSIPAGHEVEDLSPKSIALFAVVLSVVILLVLLVSYGLLRRFGTVEMRSQTPPSPLARTRQAAPGPLLQVNPAKDIAEMRAAEDARLESYGWVDPKAGVIRIPIDRAIEILARKGLPARTKAEDDNQGAGRNKRREQKPAEATQGPEAK